MLSRQDGFTLIELVMVIVILGVMAAVAIPRFYNLSPEAKQSAVDGIAGALGSASAINYAVRSQKATNGSAIADCDDVPLALEGGINTTVYEIVPAAIANGTTATCTVRRKDDTSIAQNFVGHGIS
ncbi:MAG: hypothetical protein C0618_02015 [Desulfuromonas sp.]|nr:MAG: hypothetical protein C0618_02015 [Desulfuromonas sp.]